MDGRIKQVDFAGCSLVVGYCAADCIIFVAETQPVNVFEDDFFPKIQQLDKNIVTSYAGAIQDAREVIEDALHTCLTEKLEDRAPMTVLQITEYIACLKQQHITILIGGYDCGTTGYLYVTEPYGDYNEYFCYAVGRNSKIVNECLQKNIGADASHDEESGIIAIIRSLLLANVTSALEVGVLKYNEPLKFLDAVVIEEMMKKVQSDV